MKKATWGRNLDANLEMMPIWKGCPLIFFSCQDPRIARAYTAQNTKKKSAHLACLAQRLSAFTSRCGTDTAGRGAFEPPFKDGARTKLFDREFRSRESHNDAETEKTPGPEKKNDHIYI